jgi:subtilisin
MSSQQIEEQLRATGVAQVIAVIAPAKTRSGAAGRLTDIFGLAASEGLAAAIVPRFLATGRSRNVALLAASETTRDGEAFKGRSLAGETTAVRTYPNLGLMLGTVDRQGYRALRSDKRLSAVVAAPELSLIRPMRVAPAARTKRSWGLNRLDVPALWKKGLTGRGILVGHLDTGVDASHPALDGAVHAFAEFDNLGRPVAGAKPRDSASHGTHTAGTVVGRPAGTRTVGVAPGAKLISALVIEGGNTIARVLGGMDWAIAETARVLTLSLGVRGYKEDFLIVIRRLRDLGVLPIVAVGNEGPETSRSPGNYPESLSVGACAKDNTVPLFSSSQWLEKPDRLVPKLVVPGQEVVSCIPGGGYASMSGTSMATPHVAGLAALLLEAFPVATPDQLENAILSSCERPPTMPKERANCGVPNGLRALSCLAEIMKGADDATAKTNQASHPTRRSGARKSHNKVAGRRKPSS